MDRREVPGFPGYYAADDGSIWSRKKHMANPSGDWVKLEGGTKSADHGGYKYHIVIVDKRRFNVSAHTLVLTAFKGPRPEGMHACHINGIPTDNRPDNLRWDTPSSNKQDSIKHGTWARGETSGHSVLTETDVVEIIEKRKSRVSLNDLALQYNVSHSTIQGVVYGYTWKHLEIPRARLRKGNYRRKWSTS